MSGASFRTKLLASHVGLVVLVVLALVVDLGRFLATDLEAQLDRRLEAQARGAEPWLKGAKHPGKVAERMAAMVGAEVTIFESNGEVYADTREQPEAASSNAQLPEVLAAQHGSVGRATRTEGPLRVETRFVAVQVDGRIVRLAVPLSSIRATVDATHARLLYAFIVAVVVALLLAYFASRVAARPLRAMTESAERIGRGDYAIDVSIQSPDEFGVLSKSLASLASELKARIGDLTAERDRLSAILSSMAEGVLVLGPDGKILLANPASSTVLNIAFALEGHVFEDVFVDETLRTAVAKAIQSPTHSDEEVEGIDTGGRVLAVIVRQLGDKPGTGHVVVIRDMTRIRRLLAMRHDLVANVSHELRTPVTSIRGYAETLLRGNLDAKTSHQFLEIIHRHAERIGKLVAGLLQLSELESMAPDKTVKEQVDVEAIAASVVDSLRTRAEQSHISLVVERSTPAVVACDPLGLEQVLENLVDNALKYGGKGATVRVSVKRQPASACIRVSDDGPGIEARHLPKIFDRFYRVENAESKRQGGSGLGLAIVKHLVESMGGTIEVTSELGTGTTFTVELPLASSPAKNGKSTSPHPPKVTT